MSQRKWYGKKRYLFLFAFMILIGLAVFFRFSGESKYDRRIRELAEAGYPVCKEDLDKAYVLPEGTPNAADVYLQAFTHYCPPTSSEIPFLPVRGDYERPDNAPPYEPNVIAAIESSLAQNAQCLELLSKAASIPDCLFPRRWDQCYYAMDNLSEIKNIAQLLTEQQIYLAQTNRPDETFESLKRSASLANSLSTQPYLINHLVAMALKSMLAQSLESTLDMTNFNDTQLTELQHRFAGFSNDQMFHDAMIGEQVYMIEYMKLPPEKQVPNYFNQSPPATTVLAYKLYAASGLNRTDALTVLDYYQAFLEALNLPYHQQQAVLQQLEESLDKGLLSFMHLNLHQVGSFTRVHQINLRVISSLKCAETALAVERYRLGHDRLPNSLNALIPAYMESIPLDPGDGNPLRYVLHEEGGYTIYSIGPDGVDHNGLTRNEMSQQGGQIPYDHGDWPFTVKH